MPFNKTQLDKFTLVITEIPYGTNTSTLIDSILKANEKGKIKIKKIEEEKKYLEIQLHQARGALGFPVPGDIPEGDIKCGLCQAKEKRIIEAEASRYSLYQVIKIFAQER